MVRRARAVRLVRGALWALALGHVVDAMALRRRRMQVGSLDGGGDPTDIVAKLGVVAADGVDVDAATRVAVAAEMERDGVELVDLVPGDLPAERALRLLRRMDVARIGDDDDLMYAPGGAHEALALHPSLVDRMRLDPRERTDDRRDLARRTVKAQRYAPAATRVRVAPELRAGPYGPLDRWRELEAATVAVRPYASLSPVLLGAQIAQLGALVAGAVVAPAAAATAWAAWSAKPALVFGGPGRLTPPDVGAASLLRFPRSAAEGCRTALAGMQESRAAWQRRRADPPPPAPDPAGLFLDRRDDCPWCGSAEIVGRLDTDDVFQRKPGRFHLDECSVCGHIFQNPVLTDAGLDYYYADFYEGFGEEIWEAAYAANADYNTRRVDAVAAVRGAVAPRRWLDVGTGHAHFCLLARQRWPEARFEGVDTSEAVEEAWRQGRVDAFHRGAFIDVAHELPSTFDVVTMHQYLEHTRRPKDELAAAARLLVPGGHLVVELPDPATPWSRHLGRFWSYWLQPQHLNFVRCEELVRHLQAMGLEIASVERRSAGEGSDVLLAVGPRLESLLPSSHLPWLPAPSAPKRLARAALLAAAVPMLAAAFVADAVKESLPGDDDRPGNAYRVIAKVPEVPQPH